jgi:hypothetical protein
MAGIFGDRVNSRADFYAELSRATDLVAAALRRLPGHSVLLSVQRQLNAISGWTQNGRTPSLKERRSLDMSLRMFREFETSIEDDVRAADEAVSAVHNYFEFWPDDRSAADPNNNAYLTLTSLDSQGAD